MPLPSRLLIKFSVNVLLQQRNSTILQQHNQPFCSFIQPKKEEEKEMEQKHPNRGHSLSLPQSHRQQGVDPTIVFSLPRAVSNAAPACSAQAIARIGIVATFC
jgi:hypothetical protein